MKTNCLFIIFLLSATLFSSCKKEGCTDSNATNFDANADNDDGSCEYAGLPLLNFSISHTVDGMALDYDVIQYMSEAGNVFDVENCKYFLSDAILHGSDGDVEIDGVHYVDANDEGTHLWSTGVELKAGNYSSLTLIFGLDEEKNVENYFSELPEANMEWPAMMGDGYHYMKLEGKFDSLGTGVIKAYNTHFGPSMNIPYYVTMEIPLSFSVAGPINNRVDVNLLMDINQWYENPNVYDFNFYGSAIMGNADAQTALKENGHNVISVNSVLVE